VSVKVKKWFRSSRGAQEDDDYGVEDLVVLGRYEEAEERLRTRLDITPNDLRAQLLLADVCLRTGRPGEAAERYILTADGYADDGFHDRAVALLSKTVKLMPENTEIEAKIKALREAKRREDRRTVAIKALLAQQRGGHGQSAGSSALEIEQLWNELESSSVLKALDAEQIGRFFGAGELLRVKRGRILASEGDNFEAAFFVLQGEVVCEVNLPGQGYRELMQFNGGDLFGESALLERQEFPARYRVAARSMVLSFSRRALEKILEGNPDPRGFLAAVRAQGFDAKAKEMAESARVNAGVEE
jgi:hypothetical protein